MRFFFSFYTSFILALFFMFLLIYASFISEQNAWKLVYSTKLFELMMFLLFINLTGIIIRFKIYKKFSTFIFHLSILFILIGAGITRYFSVQGIVDLKENQITNKMLLVDKASNIKKFVNLGFMIKLDRFVINRYPGSNEASSYDSYITIIDKNKKFHYHIYMNNPIVYKGFKIY
ncbi:MAG: cytochrome C biosynthesis protein, partial [Nautilia sp.]